MRLNYSTTLIEVEKELKKICNQAPDSIKTLKSIKKCLENKASELNNWLRNYEFESEADEIHFFKNIKAELLAKIIVIQFKIDIFLNLPNSKKAIPDYYNKLIDKHSQIPKRQYYFYKYFRSDSTYHDKEYFLRKNNDIQDNDQYQFLFFDERITTKMEYTLSEFIAKKQIILFLESELDKIENPKQLNEALTESGLQWTGTNLDFIELIYGLHCNKVINSGNKEVKEIAKTFCLAFNMDIEEQIYRYFIDIKRRKTNKTRFIDSMAENLNKVLEL